MSLLINNLMSLLENQRGKLAKELINCSEVIISNYKEKANEETELLNQITDNANFDSLETIPNNELSHKLLNFSYLSLVQGAIAIEPDAINVLKNLGFFEQQEKFVKVWSPADFYLGLRNIVINNPEILHASIAESVENKEAANEIFKESINPLREGLYKLLTKADYELSLMYCKAFGLHEVAKVSPFKVYTTGEPFYRIADVAPTYTASMTSGLVNPLEFFGAHLLSKILGLNERLVKVLRQYPDIEESIFYPYRILNFERGVLNPEFQCQRNYFWEYEHTSSALHRSREIISKHFNQNVIDLYDKIAKDLIGRVLTSERLQLYEIQKYPLFLKQITRFSPLKIMFSMRGGQTSHILKAVFLNYAAKPQQWALLLLKLCESIPKKVITDIPIIGDILAEQLQNCLDYLPNKRQTIVNLISSMKKMQAPFNPSCLLIKKFGPLKTSDIRRKVDYLYDHLLQGVPLPNQFERY